MYLAKTSDRTWELKATVFPQGGLGGLAQEATITSVHGGTFKAALEATSELDLSTLSFAPNPDRWPVPGPKFQIINDRSHPDRDNFGNYQIRCRDVVIGRIENFQRGRRGDLIKEALAIVANTGGNNEEQK